MIYDKLSRWRAIPGFACHQIWRAAFQWLETKATNAEEGIYPLDQDGFFARVMFYPLKGHEATRYEMHRHTVDIQYTVAGGEGIELAALDSLDRLDDYAEAKDVEHFKTPSQGLARVENLAGCFTVLFPYEPHMPQIITAGIATVRKVVIKVPVQLVAG
jgi:biofilm protein TabA